MVLICIGWYTIVNKYFWLYFKEEVIMAFGLPCYCCGIAKTSEDHFYCKECLVKLEYAFECKKGVVALPIHPDHCVSCGEFEDRVILWTGKTDVFSSKDGYGVPICKECVQEELLMYEGTTLEV